MRSVSTLSSLELRAQGFLLERTARLDPLVLNGPHGFDPAEMSRLQRTTMVLVGWFFSSTDLRECRRPDGRDDRLGAMVGSVTTCGLGILGWRRGHSLFAAGRRSLTSATPLLP